MVLCKCLFPPVPRTVTLLGPVTLLPPCTALRGELPRGKIKQTTVPWPTLCVPVVAAATLKLGPLEDVEKCLCRHFRPKRQTLLLAPCISAMPVAPVDLLLIYVGLKGRRIYLLILSLFLLIIYYVTFSKSVFDFSKSRTIIIRQEHHLTSQA